MAVKFISYVDENIDGDWFIELTDTLSNESVVCKDLNEFKQKIEDMGAQYGNEIEVEWNKSKTLSLTSYQDLEAKMAELQKEYAQEISQIDKQNENESGFNPNA